MFLPHLTALFLLLSAALTAALPQSLPPAPHNLSDPRILEALSLKETTLLAIPPASSNSTDLEEASSQGNWETECFRSGLWAHRSYLEPVIHKFCEAKDGKYVPRDYLPGQFIAEWQGMVDGQPLTVVGEFSCLFVFVQDERGSWQVAVVADICVILPSSIVGFRNTKGAEYWVIRRDECKRQLIPRTLYISTSLMPLLINPQKNRLYLDAPNH